MYNTAAMLASNEKDIAVRHQLKRFEALNVHVFWNLWFWDQLEILLIINSWVSGRKFAKFPDWNSFQLKWNNFWNQKSLQKAFASGARSVSLLCVQWGELKPPERDSINYRRYSRHLQQSQKEWEGWESL